MNLTHFSCFSGIDGFSVASHLAGFETVGQIEIGDYPNKVLERRFKDVPRWKDIRTVTKESLIERSIDNVTVMSAGFPCQPFSCAGKRNGKNDDRYLWPETLRVLGLINPRWFIGENVAGLTSMVSPEPLFELEKEESIKYCYERILAEISRDLQKKDFYFQNAPMGRQSFFLFQLAVSERHTEDTGSSLSPIIPTPTTCDGTLGQTKGKEFVGNKHALKLEQAINNPLLPSPTANGNYNKKGLSKTSGDGLATVVKEAMLPTPQAYSFDQSHQPGKTKLDYVIQETMLPTPRTTDGTGGPRPTDGMKRIGKNDQTYGINLSDKIRMLPTPTARDHKDTGNMENVPVNALLGRELGKNHGLRLQPAFVEWMMGFPINWTDPEEDCLYHPDGTDYNGLKH